jgi:hypothetical protein
MMKVIFIACRYQVAQLWQTRRGTVLAINKIRYQATKQLKKVGSQSHQWRHIVGLLHAKQRSFDFIRIN